MADQALAAITAGPGATDGRSIRRKALVDIARASVWGKRAWALALLGRQEESRQAIETASQLANHASADLYKFSDLASRRSAKMGVADTYWLTGMALLAMQETSQAADHFRKGSSADRKRKCGDLCRKQLAALERAVG
jgi:hypothetical protein